MITKSINDEKCTIIGIGLIIYIKLGRHLNGAFNKTEST
jgi:hypothetical protein